MTGTRTPAKNFEVYAPSGQLGSVWALPLLSVVAAAATAFAYGWITAHTLCLGFGLMLVVPWLLIRFALVLGFVRATAWLVGCAGRLLRVRDVGTLRLHGAIAGGLAVWWAWTVYLWQLDTKTNADADSLWTWLQTPTMVVDTIDYLATQGVHVLVNFRPTGAMLLVPWSIEALLCVVFGWLAAPHYLQARGFCENCRRWMRRQPSLDLGGDASPRDVRRQGLASLLQATPPDRDAVHWLRISRQRCPTCDPSSLYRVDQILSTPAVGVGRHVWGHGIEFIQHIVRFIVDPLLGNHVKHAEVVVPWSWQRGDDAASLQGIETALAQHPLSQLSRRR